MPTRPTDPSFNQRAQHVDGPQLNIAGDVHGPIYLGGSQPPASSASSTGDSSGIDVVILTVLQEEYQAICARLSNAQSDPGTPDAPNLYAWQIGQVPCATHAGAYGVAVGMTGRAGNIQSALAIDEALDRWKPRYLFFVGIAGGLRTCKKGDIVVADIVYGYEYGRLSRKFVPRHNWVYRTDGGLLTKALAYAGAPAWRDLIRTTPPAPCTPRVVTGEVASGDQVVDDPTNAFFAQALKSWPKLNAVEMEGAGAATAIEQAQAAGRAAGFMLIRGVSDLPRREEAGAAERDDWKPYASDAAAAFAIGLIGAGLPVPPCRPEPRSVSVRKTPDPAAAADDRIPPPTAQLPAAPTPRPPSPKKPGCSLHLQVAIALTATLISAATITLSQPNFPSLFPMRTPKPTEVAPSTPSSVTVVPVVPTPTSMPTASRVPTATARPIISFATPTPACSPAQPPIGKGNPGGKVAIVDPKSSCVFVGQSLKIQLSYQDIPPNTTLWALVYSARAGLYAVPPEPCEPAALAATRAASCAVTFGKIGPPSEVVILLATKDGAAILQKLSKVAGVPRSDLALDDLAQKASLRVVQSP